MLGKKLYVLVLIMLIIWGGYYLFFTKNLPEGYSLYTDDKYWHTALLSGSGKVIVPPTVIDYTVKDDYIFLLHLSEKYRFSKSSCNQCLSKQSTCKKYWVYNWKQNNNIGSINTEELTSFINKNNLKYPQFDYDSKKGASYICSIL